MKVLPGHKLHAGLYRVAGPERIPAYADIEVSLGATKV